MLYMKTIAIYHKDCIDGSTAAAVVLRKYPDAMLYPLGYGHPEAEIAEVVRAAKPGDRILTVDCVMGAKEFLKNGHEVTSIDHHIGIKDEYERLARDNQSFTFVFDNSRSGASLAWLTLFPEEKTPELVELVEDFDVWTWKYGKKTKDANSYLFLLINQPAEIAKLFDAPLDSLIRDGGLITRYSDTVLELATKTTEPINVTIGAYSVPFYNITSQKSEAGNILSTQRDRAVGLFSIDGGVVKISFRSLDRHVPSALDLAKALGGGGHRNASGASMRLDAFVQSIQN